jgi:DNA-binding transcriptional LysR family regulator
MNIEISRCEGAMRRLENVDLRLLRIFATVVEAGGFAGAQIALNLSQSTISTHMATLEDRLGFTLCQRGRRGFRLTEAGRTVYEQSLEVFRALDGFATQCGGYSGRLAGTLRLGIVDATISHPFSPLQDVLRRFSARDHAVHVDLEIGAPQELEQAVVDGRRDLAIGPFSQQGAGVTYRPIFQEPQELYCGRGHPLFTRSDARINRADLAASPFVARAYMHRADLDRIGHPRPGATVHHMEAQAMLVLSGGYIGFLPRHYAAPYVAEGRLRAIRSDEFGYSSTFYAATRASAAGNRVLAAFVEDLDTILADAASGPAAAAWALTRGGARMRAPAARVPGRTPTRAKAS